MTSSKKKSVPVYGLDGFSGVVSEPFTDGPSRAMAQITLNDGRHVFVDPAVLQVQADGTYLLPLGLADLPPHSASEQKVVPLIQEQLEFHKHRVETGKVRVVKSVVVENQVVDLPVLREEVSIERVAVERFVTQPPPVRQEGDVMIISLLEEVVVVEKRLMVREEIRLTTRRIVTHEPHPVSLKKEVATVERVPVGVLDNKPGV